MPQRIKKYKKKSLNGSELANFIKQRQLRQSRSTFGQRDGVRPKLAIVKTVDDPAIETYVALKKRYGEDIEVDVDIHNVEISKIHELLHELNSDIFVDAIIVQLPLSDAEKTEEVLSLVDPSKDVDGLNPERSEFDSATASAILWLLAGYNVELRGKRIVVVGQGRLVGGPVAAVLESSGLSVTRCDKSTNNLQQEVEQAEILITAAGAGEIIASDWIQPGTVVVDAGVAGEQGEVESDVEATARERDDISITPLKGGVGPLTVCALFENVLKAVNN